MNRLEELVKAHLAVVGLLESRVLSEHTRMPLESLRIELEQQIAAAHGQKQEKSAAAS